MNPPFQFVGLDITIVVMVSSMDQQKALLVRDDHGRAHIITQDDLLVAMTS